MAAALFSKLAVLDLRMKQAATEADFSRCDPAWLHGLVHDLASMLRDLAIEAQRVLEPEVVEQSWRAFAAEMLPPQNDGGDC